LDFGHGGDAAPGAQSHINQHQIGIASGGGGNCAFSRGFQGANVMPHANENIHQQNTDNGIVFDDQNIIPAHPGFAPDEGLNAPLGIVLRDDMWCPWRFLVELY
jgi:hypothetical protein